MSIHDDVIHFNIAGLGTLLIFDDVGTERGYWTIKGCESENQVRQDTSRRKSTDAAKIRRRKLRAKRINITNGCRSFICERNYIFVVIYFDVIRT